MGLARLKAYYLYMLQVDFYFDYGCPWAYLGFHRLRETAMRVGAEIIYKPLILKDLIKSAGGGIQMSPAQEAYLETDLEAWSDFCGLPLNLPDSWPVDTTLAARTTLLAADHGKMLRFTQRIFSALYERGEDVSNVDALKAIAGEADIAPESIDAALQDSSVSERLTSNALELTDRGGFGVPTMFVDDQMFFGNDRMPLVEFALGQASGRRFVLPGQHG